MPRFDVEENLNIIISLLMLVGTWPKNSPSTLYRIRGFTTVFIIVAGILLTSGTVLKFADIQTVCFAICCLLVLINIIVKYFFIFIKRKHLFNLMKMLNAPVLSLHEDHLYKFLEKKAEMVRFFQNGFLVCGIGTGMLILLGPIFNTTSMRPIPMPFFVNVEEKGFLVYGLAWLYEISLVLLACVSICSFDGLIFFFIGIAGAELKILREKIIEAAKVVSLDSRNIQDEYQSDKKINRLLKKCVIQHIAIER